MKPYQIKCREEGHGKPSVEKFATLPEAQTYIKDRWQGADYMDGNDGFHTDCSTYELIGFSLKDVGTVSWQGEGNGMWRDYKFTDFTAEKKPEAVTATTHSPGPWAYSVSLGEPKTWIAYSQTTGQSVATISPEPEQEANARLLACAPELLAGLVQAEISLFGYVSAGCPGASESSEQGTQATLALVRTLIGKAQAPTKAEPAKPVPLLPADRPAKKLSK